MTDSHLKNTANKTPSQDAARNAVRTLIQYAGDDPDREGMKDTPSRVAKAWKEMFGGYAQDPSKLLATQFSETSNYKNFILLRDIPLHSHCEHHILPIHGRVHVAYIPDGPVVGFSKLQQLVNGFAKRFQIQERLTSQIGDALNEHLKPKGVAVIVEAQHDCMSSRGINKEGLSTNTSYFSGSFENNPTLQQQLFHEISAGKSLGK